MVFLALPNSIKEIETCQFTFNDLLIFERSRKDLPSQDLKILRPAL